MFPNLLSFPINKPLDALPDIWEPAGFLKNWDKKFILLILNKYLGYNRKLINDEDCLNYIFILFYEIFFNIYYYGIIYYIIYK